MLDDAVRGLVSDEADELAALVHERADLVARRVLRVLGDARLQLRLRLLRRADGHRLGLGAGERVADDAVAVHIDIIAKLGQVCTRSRDW